MSEDLRTVRAEEAMSREIVWCEAHESVRAAAVRMRDQKVRALLVRAAMPRDLPGILTSKDVVNLLGTHDTSVFDHLTVADVMTRPAMCVVKDANLVDCLNVMRMCGVRRLPVLDGLEVVGVLSSSDVFARALAE